MGVKTSMQLCSQEIADWVINSQPIKVKFDNDLPAIVDAILHAPHQPKRKRKAA
jgi:hypothetical protein